MGIAVNTGDRVLLRDRPWRVRKPPVVSGDHHVIEVEALDAHEPRSLTIVTPPEDVLPLSSEDLQFDLGGLDSFPAWSRAHRAIGATLVRETGLLTGARFGRVALEAYQIAPTLRLLAKPRSSLLIADDVGLGKTIEAGLALLELMARGRAQRILIVAPPGLLRQWQEELKEKFGLDFRLIENASALSQAQSEMPAGINPWDVLPRVLTSIDFIKKDTVRGRALRKRWDLIVVDEAHALAESGTDKNPYATQRARLGRHLRDASRGLILLTATPHNGYSHSFRSLIELVEPTHATFHGSPETIRRRIDTARIRRMKAQIHRFLEGKQIPFFPQREVQGIEISTKALDLELLRKVSSYCSKTARQAGGLEEEDLITFAMQIVKKRALSSRRALEKTLEHRLEALRKEDAREEPPDPNDIRELQSELPLGEARAERTARRVLRSAIPKEERIRNAEVKALTSIKKLLQSLRTEDPKVAALLRHLKEIFAKDPGEKAIVFTEYVDTLEAVQQAIDKEPALADAYVILRGGLSPLQRLKRQEAFESPKVRILLATDAASEGLNLQRHCRRVIHMELPWNPNRLEQRNGRVDRYGQAKSPIIRYLYYPASAEDDVLARLVQKIEQMRADRISTPDILGVMEGSSIGQDLVALDPEAEDVEKRKATLVQHFEDRTAEFVRNVQPLVAAGAEKVDDEQKRLLDLLGSAVPLLPDDQELESLVRSILGPSAFSPRETDGIFRIEVSPAFRGPNVKPVYPLATFRRSLAIKFRADEVEFVTPFHPLVAAIVTDARRRLLQVYPSDRGLPPRRLAARRVGRSEPPSILFTFLASVQGGGGLVEERILTVRLDANGKSLGAPAEQMKLLEEERKTGEVSPELLKKLFAASFDRLRDQACKEAARAAAHWTDEAKTRRRRQAELLLADLEVDLADRLKEIDEEEESSRHPTEKETGQARFFQESETRGGFDARRAAAKSQAATRRAEIEEYARVADPLPPRPMGALFLVPEGM